MAVGFPVLSSFFVTNSPPTVLFGIDSLAPNLPEYRAFLTFPLDGVNQPQEVVPGNAVILSANVEVFQAKAKNVSVTIPSVPIMSGVVSRGGKFRAVAKRGKTATKGVDGKFSVAGRVEKGNIQFLFIAEFFEGDKPLCTQSWNASGPRQ